MQYEEDQFDLIINRHTAIHLGLHDNIQVGSLSSSSSSSTSSSIRCSTTSTSLEVNTSSPQHSPPTEEHTAVSPRGQKVREINLSVSPFKFPVPVCQAPDATPAQFYALWDLSSLADFTHWHADKIRSFE